MHQVRSGRDDPPGGTLLQETFIQRERECQLRIIEEAKKVDMKAADFRKASLGLILKGEASPGHLISQGLAQRLNIIFDIDNTLVHTVPATQAPLTTQSDFKTFRLFCRKFSL